MSAKKQLLLIYLFLTAATLLAFWHVSQCDFINLDDPKYVTENIHIRYGTTMAAIRWAFTTGYAANWHPVTWMSHMLDVQLFGLNPHRHHLVNILFHIANTLLLFFAFHRMTKATWKSAFMAALFALHPLHVESVAWVAERKDVLSTFLWMLTMAAYIYYVERPSLFRYSAVVMFFALGLMAKPMLVTLPLALLLLDYWPLQRLQGAGSENEDTNLEAEPLSNHKYQLASIRLLLLEKIPLFALAALSCIVTFIAQQEGGAVKSIEAFPPGVRIANAFVSYIIYIRKSVWPNDLAVFYPHPGPRPLWQALAAALFLGIITLTVIRTAKRFPYLATGWLWFTGTLVPVIGVVQVGHQGMGDRYTYIPLIGLFVMAAWGIPELLRRWRPVRPSRKQALFAASSIALLSLFIVTWTQAGYWRNSMLLYDHALKVTDRNYFVLQARGTVYFFLGDLRQAIFDYDRAIEINPHYAEAYYNRGVVHSTLGNHKQALEDYNRSIEIDPAAARAYNGRAGIYISSGNLSPAIEDLQRAVEIDPDYVEAHFNLGCAYTEVYKHWQAIGAYDRAIELDRKYVAAYVNRGLAYDALGDYPKAIEDFNKAIEINPGDWRAYHGRSATHAKIGQDVQAVEDSKKAAQFRSGDAKDPSR